MEYTLYHYDVVVVERGTITCTDKKYMNMCMFLCFHVNFKLEST